MAQYLASITLANGQVVGVVFQPIGNADVLAALGFTPLPSTTILVSSWNGRTGAVTLQSGDVTAALGFTPLSGNQTVTLSGDATGSGATAITVAISTKAVTTAKIDDAAVTLAKIANAAANSKLLGSGASGSGASYSEITLGAGLTMTVTTLSASGGMSIGGAVAGGTAGLVLFVKTGPVLAQDANFAWDTANKQLVVTGKTGTGITSLFAYGDVSGYYAAALATGDSSFPGYAGAFVGLGGTLNVILGDGNAGYAVNVAAGGINTLGTTGNTYRWGTDHVPPGSTQAAAAATVYGAGTINNLLGEPDSWVLVSLGGTDYLLPAYLP